MNNSNNIAKIDPYYSNMNCRVTSETCELKDPYKVSQWSLKLGNYVIKRDYEEVQQIKGAKRAAAIALAIFTCGFALFSETTRNVALKGKKITNHHITVAADENAVNRLDTAGDLIARSAKLKSLYSEYVVKKYREPAKAKEIRNLIKDFPALNVNGSLFWRSRDEMFVLRRIFENLVHDVAEELEQSETAQINQKSIEYLQNLNETARYLHDDMLIHIFEEVGQVFETRWKESQLKSNNDYELAYKFYQMSTKRNFGKWYVDSTKWQSEKLRELTNIKYAALHQK